MKLYAIEDSWNTDKLYLKSVNVRPTKGGYVNASTTDSGRAFRYRTRFRKGDYAETPQDALEMARQRARGAIDLLLKDVEHQTQLLCKLDVLEADLQGCE
jgi:hypothetical protein